MLKIAKFLSVFFHPLFITFYNFLFLLLLSDSKGAILGFMVTLFFLTMVLIPLFYTAAVLYNDNKEFELANISDMAMHSRKKLLIYTVFYNVLILLIVISLNKVFLGKFKPMFASLIMGFILSMMVSFILHLLNLKNSLHTLAPSFYAAFGIIFSWKVPGMEDLPNTGSSFYLLMGIVNLAVLGMMLWSRSVLKAHDKKEILFGILIGILSPIILSLLTYGI